MKYENWNGVCRCGHLHSEHGKSQSINYTAGKCQIKDCDCQNFILSPHATSSSKFISMNEQQQQKEFQEEIIKQQQERIRELESKSNRQQPIPQDIQERLKKEITIAFITYEHTKKPANLVIEDLSAKLSQLLAPELQHLREWKRQAMEVMPDMQAIGKALGIKLGETVYDKILSGIERQKSQIDELKIKYEALDKSVKASRDVRMEQAAEIESLKQENERLKERERLSEEQENNPYWYWPQCDVEGCEGVSCNGGGCWRETGYWSVCPEHSKMWREGKPQPKMKQSAIDKEATRDKVTGMLPPPPKTSDK